MEGISKIPMSSFFLLGLFLIVPGTAAQTDTTNMNCATLRGNLSTCADLFGIRPGAVLGIGITPPRRCCQGLQQIKASAAVLGASRTCNCLRRSSIFSGLPDPLECKITTAFLDIFQAGCSLALGVDITTDLSCLCI